MNYFKELDFLIYDEYLLNDLREQFNDFKTAEEIKIYTETIDKQNNNNKKQLNESSTRKNKSTDISME